MPCLPPTIKTYPLFSLRRALLLLTLPAFLFALLSLTNAGYSYRYYDTAPFVFHLFAATLSLFLGLYELVRWGIAKAQDPDADPKFPLRRVLAADALLAVGLGVFVWPGEVSGAGNGDGVGVVMSYASVVALVAAVLHAVCAWKQLMAVKKKQWEEAAAAENGCARLCRARCLECGSGYREEGLDTPVSSGGLDLTRGYEIIPDKMAEVEGLGKGRKGKGAARSGLQASLMEV